MKELKNILKGVSVETAVGDQELLVSAVVFDSRKTVQDALFVAQKGVDSDGHLFIEKAIELGAKAVLCESLPQDLYPGVCYIKVRHSNDALAVVAANFYDNPSRKLKLVGVTGTNGKTTVATLLYELFQNAGYHTGLLSTVKIKIGSQTFKATHTTPDSVSINRYLAQMIEQGVTHCFMEVSSHGIHQSRTEGLDFDGGVFTNLSHDHLDYHKTFSGYRDVKKKFFDNLSKDAFALTNVDDKNGNILLQNTKAKKTSYAMKSMADFKVKILEKDFSGMLLQLDRQEVWVRLIGDFNAYNLASIYAVANLLGVDKQNVLRLMSQLESVDGRFEYQRSAQGIVTIVDYAHTPDALKNVLETIRGIRSGTESLITVVGCGGDRDRTKRSKMGAIASELSDQVVFTSDNPRFEDPQEIINQIESGVAEVNLYKTLSVIDRKQAIKNSCKICCKRRYYSRCWKRS